MTAASAEFCCCLPSRRASLRSFVSVCSGKLQGADFLLIALGICLVVLFAQLLANDVHLLAQIVVALPLVDVLLDLLGDFVFQL